MFPMGEFDDLPRPREAIDTLLHVYRQCAQLLRGHDMFQGADLPVHLPDHQIVAGKVQNVPERIPLNETRVLGEKLFVVDGLDGFQAAL